MFGVSKQQQQNNGKKNMGRSVGAGNSDWLVRFGVEKILMDIAERFPRIFRTRTYVQHVYSRKSYTIVNLISYMPFASAPSFLRI